MRHIERKWPLFPIAGLSALLSCFASPAQACRMHVRPTPEDVSFADVVVVGRITNYRIVRDMEFRRRMLRSPNLPPETRRIYEGPGTLMSDYARFQIVVDEMLVGDAGRRISVTWQNSTYGLPAQLPSGPMVIALRSAGSPAPPLRGPSATIMPVPEPNLLTILQAPCSSAFMFERMSNEGQAVLRIVAARRWGAFFFGRY